MKMKYEIINAGTTCNGGLDLEIAAQYLDSFELGDFPNDKAAIEAAEEVQQKHDAQARMLAINNERLLDEIIENAPSYVDALYCVDGGEERKVEP